MLDIFFFTITSLFLIAIFLTDALYFSIPDELVIPAIVTIFILQIVRKTPVPALLIAAAIAGGFFLLQYLISRGTWIGSGDIKLGILMGLILGIQKTILALFIAYGIGLLFATALILLKNKTRTTKFPFGTLLVAATLISLFLGDDLISRYRALANF